MPRLAVFAVKHLAHRLPPRRIHRGLIFEGVFGLRSARVDFVIHTALRAPIGKPWFVRPQLKFFRADTANFNWKRHKHLSTLKDSVLCDSTTWPRRYLRIRKNQPASLAEPANFTLEQKYSWRNVKVHRPAGVFPQKNACYDKLRT
jgi:hypothetical protein